MKTAQTPGFYSNELLDDAFNEALDYVAAEMFMADEGWLAKMMTYDTVANQLKLDLTISVSMIREVRYMFGDIYVPLVYDAGNEKNQAADSSGIRQWAYTYRILDNALYFNPALAEGGTNYLQVEYISYPKRLQDDTDFMESQFDNAMLHFCKYKMASICAAAIENYTPAWAGLESLWFQKMRDIIVKRNLQSIAIQDFAGF